ncbi:anaerobic ribonucleoside-triphosphate reductase activating protein [Modicisalibacter radicis]|uniref:anaerobic ribonucleoside-triphosphate reductase activating protein n=1 Tax=Halomonas sp. EAR18 TaxID=2518972 RepID=UPI001FCEF45F|nr:anaerobic ribonucleoside-triphosphate reductase activating protein [Halomonas sp. EAR18]
MENSLPIAGLTLPTLQEFPGCRACTVFLQGPPSRHGYGHYRWMIAQRRGELHAWPAVRDLLDRRHDQVDGVVISGGEPTRHHGLNAVLRDIKAHGFASGLHTSGLYPRRLAEALPWLDWVRLDIKGWGMSAGLTRRQRSIWRRNVQSLALLLDSDIELECRITLHWRAFSLRDLERLAMSLADCGVRHLVLQQCIYTLSPDGAPSDRAVDSLASRLAAHFERVTVRR